MVPPDKEPFDLDEDLFDFDEILEETGSPVDKVNLDELLQALEEDEEEEEEPEIAELAEDDLQPAAPLPSSHAPVTPTINEPEDNDLIGVEEEEELVPAAAARPAETAEAASPAPVVVAAAPALSGRVARVGFLLLGALALLNVVQMALSWERNRDLAVAVTELEGRFLSAAGDLEQSLFQQTEAMERNRLPVVAPDAAGRETLDYVVRQLEAGEFGAARRRLYSLLAVTDRYDPEAAREIEASATYLLADSWRLQAETVAELEDAQ